MSSLFFVSNNAKDTLSMKARTLFVPQLMVPSFKISPTSGAKILGSTSSGGMDVLLSGNEGAKLQLANGYAAIRQLTAACHGINATIFTPPGRTFDWFDGLNQKLNIVKSYANEWLYDISNDVTSTIPSSVESYNNTFQSHIKVIQGVLLRYKNAIDVSDDDLRAIREVLGRIITKVDSVSDSWLDCKNRMVKWVGEVDIAKNIKTGISGAKYDLQEGSDSIQKAASELAIDIDKYETLINGLYSEIGDFRKMVGLGAGLAIGGIATSSIGAGLCFVFPAVGGIVLALGIGMIAGGASVWGVFQKKINDAYADISAYRQSIADNTATLTALSSLSTASVSVVAQAQTAIEKMSDVQVIWSAYGKSLLSLSKALEAGNKDELSILISADTEEAKLHWETLSKYSQELLASTSEVKIVEGNQKVVA